MVVTIRDLAVELGKSRAALKTHCRVRGYRFSRLRTPGSRGSLAVAISDADAQRVRAHYAPETRHTAEGQTAVVTLRQLAEEFRMKPASMRAHCRLKGYGFARVVTPASRKRETFAVSATHAERIRAHYHRRLISPFDNLEQIMLLLAGTSRD